MAIRIPIIGRADFRQATASVKRFSSSSNKEFKGIQNSLRSLNNLAAGFVAFLAVRQVVRGLNTITQAAAIQEDAINQLNTSLRLAGSFTEEASLAIQEFGAEIERTTRFGDELVIQQVALARNFARSNEEAIALTRTAIDLSEATGISLDSAVRNLGKTFSGLVGELGELVPQVRSLTTEQLQAGEAIRVLSERFGGAAQQRVRTFSGATEQLNNTYGTLLETLGLTITQNPAVVGAINALSTEINEIIKVIDANRTSLQSFITNGLLLVVRTTPLVIKSLDSISRSIQGVGFAFRSVGKLIGALFATPLFEEDILAPGKPLANALEDIGNDAQEVNSQFEASAAVIDQVQKSADSLAASIREAAKAGGTLKESVSDITITPKVTIPEAEIRKQLGEIVKVPVSLLFEDFDKLSEGQRAVGGIASGLNAALKGAQGATELISGTLGAIADTILPGIGGVVSSIVSQLAKGPEAAAEFIRSFVTAIPEIVANIITAIPAVVEAFVESIPVFIERLVAAVPQVIDALVRSSPRIILALIRGIPDIINSLIADLPRFINEFIASIPQIASDFVSALVSEAPRFITELIKALGDSIGGGIPGIGGGDGGGGIPIVSDVVDFVGDTLGGIFGVAAPSPGTLQPIPEPQEAIDIEGNRGGMTTIQLRVGERDLANVILDLNRKGFRTA